MSRGCSVIRRESPGRKNFFKNSANPLDDETSESADQREVRSAKRRAAFPIAFAGKGLRWYSCTYDWRRRVADPAVVFLFFVFSLIARTSAGRIEMRSLINAMNSVVVNGQLDRTNVAGVGSLRGLDLLLSSCIYSGRALHTAFLSGLKSIKPEHQRTALAEQRMFARAEAPCWHPAQPYIGSPAFAYTT
jgi:hypothetical protein